MNRSIAIVEDDPDIRANYIAGMERMGYSVRGYGDRETASTAFRSRLPDLVVLDIALGADMDAGFEMCRELRAASSTLPIIFLTARDSEIDAISGLRLGADDYLTKDISLPHITARIAALFRRIDSVRREAVKHDAYTVGDLEVDEERIEASWQGNLVDLTLTEFWIVCSLTRHPGHVKSRTQLMDDANVVVDDATVTSHIKRIRRKFREYDVEFDSIETVYGMGYRWKH